MVWFGRSHPNLFRAHRATMASEPAFILDTIVCEQSRSYLACACLISSANANASNSSSIGFPSAGLIISDAIILFGRGMAAKAMTISRCAWVGTNGFGPRPLTILLIPPSFRSFRAIGHPSDKAVTRHGVTTENGARGGQP